MRSTLLTIACLVALLVASGGSWLDACALDRFSPSGRLALQRQFPLFSERTWIRLFTVNAFLCAAMLFTFPASHYHRVRWLPAWINPFAVWMLLTAHIIYLSINFIAQALKMLLMDSQCHLTPNSVSGHTILMIMLPVSLALIQLALYRLHYQPESPRRSLKWITPWHADLKSARCHSVAFSLLFAAQSVMAFLCLYQTFAFGFHSARQMLLGTIVACLALIIVKGCIDSIISSNFEVIRMSPPSHSLPARHVFLLAMFSAASMSAAFTFASHRVTSSELTATFTVLSLLILINRCAAASSTVD